MRIAIVGRRASLLFMLVASGCVTVSTPVPLKNDVPAFRPHAIQHVVVVVLENKDFEDALRQPFLARLAKEGALLHNSYAIAHPSQPNYIAMISGSSAGVRGDGVVTLDRPHLGDTLTKRGVSWRSYAEGYPGGCSKVKAVGRYVRKHEPFLSFADVQRNEQGMCDHIVNGEEFLRDAGAGTLPQFSLFIPDLDDDAHDQPLEYADRWLSRTFGPLMTDEFRRTTLLIVTFDEDDGHGKHPNHIYTAFWGAGILPDTVSNDVYDHYDLLRTIEAIFHLDPLPTAGAARAVGGIWQ